LGAFSREDRAQLFRPAIWQQLSALDDYAELKPYLKEVDQLEPGNQVLYSYLRSYLLDEVLVKVDRATMMASLEARSPFLDFKVVELAQALPYRYKLAGWRTKFLLKKLMMGRLPAAIIWRPKKGFGVPLSRWLRQELRPWSDQVLSLERLERLGLFNYDYIAKLKDEHFSGRADHRKKLWTLLVFCLWAQRWLKKSSD
jgi:asparagine synthase (glutamine-hydrolysing)